MSVSEAEALLAPGFHRGIDFDAYVEIDAANSSILHEFRRTPAHAYHVLTTGGHERTPSLDLGWLFHLAVIEPDRFDENVVEAPKLDKRTKKGKEAWAAFQAEHHGKTLVDKEKYSRVIAMRDSALSHPTAKEFFGGDGFNEITVLWEERATGVRCKCRIDRASSINEWPVIGDLKSARDASRRAFERAIATYGYHVQAAHYLDGCETNVPIEDGNPFRRFFFFVTESEPPYCTAVHEIDDAALTEGKLQRDRYLRSWKECTASGHWPGYPDGVQYVSLPPWAFKAYIDE